MMPLVANVPKGHPGWKMVKCPECGALDAHIRSIDPGSSTEYGIIVAIPKTRMLEDEFQNPTPLDGNLDKWKLAIAIKCFGGRRKRSMVELLFCMLRSGR